VSSISNLVAGANRASLGNIANAEQINSRALGQLGHAASAKSNEDKMAFNINEMQPFERKYNLLAAKASGGNKSVGAGISNIFGGFNAYKDMQSAQNTYGL
jgi:hypothetical protein